MEVIEDVSAVRERLSNARAEGKRIAFVPTMGNLHPGHLKLVSVAKQHADFVIVSIFVNPLQFGPGEDFEEYPRTPEEDQSVLQALNVDILFQPRTVTMYPDSPEKSTFVEVPVLSDKLCGKHRPGHFRGVTTVVNRLFNIVQPDIAVFGKKDYQQLVIIRKMVADLAIPIEILGVDTVRETDQLAMSSRNNYLDAGERKIAPTLYATLDSIRSLIISIGEVPDDIEQQGMKRLKAAGFEPEYVSIRRQSDLQPPEAGDHQIVILAAAKLGNTRLIDNIEIELNTDA
ncbi:MAG: pantoate--beta-alanine ligase [Acidiferrobacterales bacterium]